MVLSASLTFRIPNKYIVLKHMIHPNTMISLNIGADRRINLEKRPTFALGRHNCEKKTGKHFLILVAFHFGEYKRRKDRVCSCPEKWHKLCDKDLSWGDLFNRLSFTRPYPYNFCHLRGISHAIKFRSVTASRDISTLSNI